MQAAYGIDISAEMIAAAQRRCAGLRNVYLMTCSGRDLLLFRSEMFDGLYVVDTFPYLHMSGVDLVVRHFQEAGRVLRPKGEFLVLNFSYRDSPKIDRLEVEQLAQECGFEVLENGVQPFQV